VPTNGAEKRWRIRGSPLVGALRMTAEEVAEIEAAASRLAQEGYATRAATLRGAAGKLRAMMDQAALRRAEADVEAILAGEGLASRPGPRVRVAEGRLETLRHALLAARRVRVVYRAASGEEREHVLEPCGLLYGPRPYLLATKPGKADAAVWRLDRMLSVVETDESFTPAEGFDLATLMRDCFGVWRAPAQEVSLRFAPAAAAEAATWHFHASQTVEPQPDGTLLVRFRAGGIDEMAYHLATWGEAVEVISPTALRDRLAEMGRALLRRHGAEEERPGASHLADADARCAETGHVATAR
jgi:predicted DNA-binding transcriptional regulator YafY